MMKITPTYLFAFCNKISDSYLTVALSDFYYYSIELFLSGFIFPNLLMRESSQF